MNADIIVIGPIKYLYEAEALDYSIESYGGDYTSNTVVIGTLAVAHTTNQSMALARLCNVEAWDLRGHRLKLPIPEPDIESLKNKYLGNPNREYQELYNNIIYLLSHDCDVWYRPNG